MGEGTHTSRLVQEEGRGDSKPKSNTRKPFVQRPGLRKSSIHFEPEKTDFHSYKQYVCMIRYA